MHLVTLFAAYALGAGIHSAPSCPAPAPVMGQVLSVDADGPSTAQSTTANKINGRPHATPAIDQWQAFITEASGRFAIPETWIRAVMKAESAGQTILDGRPITSPAGAMGLMQVMPETYAEMRLRYGLGADPYDPRALHVATAQRRVVFSCRSRARVARPWEPRRSNERAS